jgi:hypothetical protein
MLYGTDLSSAYEYGYDTAPKNIIPQSPKQIEKLEPMKQQPQKQQQPNTQSLDPNFLTSDQKLHLLSNEILKQKEMFQQNRQTGYFDKLLSKKKDIIKLVIFALMFLFAISVHYFLKHYLKSYIEENALTAGKEFLIRLLYPVSILLLLWNIKAFSK